MVGGFKAVAVHGAKGGVGKSSVAVNLALELHERGLRVGFLDADLDSPYAAEVLGIRAKVGLDANRTMLPVEFGGIKVMSFAAWVPEEVAVATMQGQVHSQWLQDALEHTDWGGIQVLVCDMPAGSSDEWLTTRNVLGDDLVGMIGVGVPNVVTGVQRVYGHASIHRVRILGFVENMSGEVYGSGTVEAFCKEKGLRFLGRIPLDKRIREAHMAKNPRLPDDLLDPIRQAATVVQEALK